MSAICLHIGRLEEARSAHERAQRSNPKTRTVNLESYYLYRGVFAWFAALVDETSLERTVATGFACWPFFRVDPHLAAVHGEARFTRIVAGLEEKYAALEIQRW